MSGTTKLGFFAILFILSTLWFCSMLYIIYLGDQEDLSDYLKKQGQKDLKGKKAEDKNSSKKDQENENKPKIIEPYDTKAFREQSENFDIKGFTESWNLTHKHKI